MYMFLYFFVTSGLRWSSSSSSELKERASVWLQCRLLLMSQLNKDNLLSAVIQSISRPMGSPNSTSATPSIIRVLAPRGSEVTDESMKVG